MNAKKLRRKLIVLCFCLLASWVITTFPLMVMWYIKGSGHGWNPDVSDTWRMFIFAIIPGVTSGYLLFGLFLWSYLLKSKKSDNGLDTPTQAIKD